MFSLISIPNVYAANDNLFVSAENSQFDNYMSGPQVIEVMVIDSDIDETNEVQGEPDITVNGKILRMVQAVDGNWYGYFADETMATLADSTTITIGEGLDFGVICTSAEAEALAGPNFSDADSIAIPFDGCAGYFDDSNNVVREAKDVNEIPTLDGQIGITDLDTWPFIQLYQLNPTGNIVIQYNKGGGVQTTTLTFDIVEDYASASFDRAIYGPGMEVHATITDPWLNIDPTDEDSWTFGTQPNDFSFGSYYQVFDEDGNSAGDGVDNTSYVLDQTFLDGLMCEDNCRLILDINTQDVSDDIIGLQGNADSNIMGIGTDATTFASAGGTLPTGSVPVTVTEQGPNSGIFSTTDELDMSNIVISSNAKRGTLGTFDYNGNSAAILVGFDFGSIDIQPVDDEWNSGEKFPVVVNDNDLNTNSYADEDLDLFNPDLHHVPTLQTGNPITLENIVDADFDGADVFPPATYPESVEQFSQRAFLEANSGDVTVGDADTLTLLLDTTFEELYESILEDGVGDFRGVSLMNYDIRSIFNNAEIDNVTISISDGVSTVEIANNADAHGLVNLTDNAVFTPGPDFFDLNESSNVILKIEFSVSEPTVIPEGTVMPIVVDFFTFGFFSDGVQEADRVANQIIRLELEETGDNTGLFAGSLEYVMITQFNILDTETYEGLVTIADDPNFIVIDDLTDEDAPRVNYLDIGADGVATQIADQQEAPTHSGTVSFDMESYKIADTVTITLEDQDLNVDSDLIEIYTTVVDDNDIAFGTLGQDSLPDLSFGPLGRVLEVTFDDFAWKTPQGTCDLFGTFGTGLDDVSFSMIETGAETGVFIGDFIIPDRWCREDDGNPQSTVGLDIEVNYVDFRDASGEIIEVGDSAGIRSNTGSNNLIFDQIGGSTLKLPNNDGALVFPPNLDLYFPTNHDIRERIQELEQQGIDLRRQFHEIQSVNYEGGVLTLKKTTTVSITNYDEFVLIFGNDDRSKGTVHIPNNDRPILIDNNYVLERVNSLLEECSQTLKAYCEKNPDELKDLIFDKIGTHTINETLYLKKITAYTKGEYIDDSNPFASVIPVNHEQFIKNESPLLTIVSDLEKISNQHTLFPSVDAQPGQFQNPVPNTYNLSFLNGFTIGYGFERDWSYEYNLLDIIPIYAEIHVEAGLGVGFRIPIDIKMEMAAEQSDQTGNFVITYTANTLDIDEIQYIEMGLHPGQGFAGKEFNSYLGPRLEIIIQVFEEVIYELDKSLIPINKPPGNDFVPPLYEGSTTITEYELDCDFTHTCMDISRASGGLFVGMQADMVNGKITMDSQHKKPTTHNPEIAFAKNGDQKKFEYNIDDLVDTASGENLSVPYDITLQNVRYYSVLDIIPKIKLSVNIDAWIFPLEFGTEWIHLPSIKFDNVLFGTHDGTEGSFNAISVWTKNDNAEDQVEVEIETSNTNQGDNMKIDLTFKDNDGIIAQHVNYNIKAIQNGKVILDKVGLYDSAGLSSHQTMILDNAASTDNPVDIEVTFLGYGIDPSLFDPEGQVISKHVIPEFNGIAIMILAVTLISIIVATRINTRFHK